MKKIILIGAMILSLTAVAGPIGLTAAHAQTPPTDTETVKKEPFLKLKNLTIGTGYGVETISEALSVDLFQVQGFYRFNTGITLGGMYQKGYPNLSAVNDETRYMLMLGYTTRIKAFSPYAFYSLGWRDYENTDTKTVDYFTVKLGTRYKLTNKFFTDINYRYRDSDDITWETETVTAGIGYNINPKLSVMVNRGWQRGDYDSEITSVAVITRF
jgi:opacity protein-like surface antigen